MKNQDSRQFWLPRATPCLLLILLLASFGLRVYRLGDKSVWWDEGLAAWAARQSLAEIARWTAADVHPPLYFWMLHSWRWGSGDTEFGLRSLSAAIGVLTVAATYRLGRAVAGSQVGLLAALLVGISRFDIWWSQEMRMYALAALFATLALWTAIRFWDRGTVVDGALYVLFTAAGLYTLYLLVSVLVVANLTWLGVSWRGNRRRQALLRWGAAQVAALLLFAPWLLYALGRIPTWSSASPMKAGVFLRIYWTVLTVGIPVNVESYWWLTLPVLAVTLAGLASLLWRTRREWRVGRDVALLLLGLLLPAAVVYLVSLPRETFFYSPQLAPRYLLLYAPAFYVLLAWGLSRLGKSQHWPLRAISTVVVVGAAGYGLWEYYPGRILKDDYKSLAATLHAYQRPGDAVVLYTDKDWPVFAYHHPGQWWKVPHALRLTPEAAAAYVSPIWKDHEGIWLVITPYAGVNDPQGEVPAWLATRAVDVVEHRFTDKVLRFYARTQGRARTAQELSPGARPPYPLQSASGSGTRLVGYEHRVREYRPGDTIHLFLYWQRSRGSKQAVANLPVSLVGGGRERELTSGHGQTWKRVEAAVPDVSSSEAPVRQQIDLAIPPDAPGGRYTFAVGPLAEGTTLFFGRISLRPWRRPTLSAADVAIAHPLEAVFGDGVRLLGYDLEAEALEPGGTVYLTLYWQARHPVEQRYKVFTHVLGEAFNAGSGNFVWGQQDNEPVSDTRPTSTWRTDEVVVDSYAILLDPQAPDGRYALEIGLYNPATIERLPVLNDQGQVVADHVVVTHVSVKRD